MQGYGTCVTLAVFLVKTEPMSGSDIAATTADGSLDNYSGSGKRDVMTKC